MASIRKAQVRDIPRILEMAHGFYEYGIKDKGLRYEEESFAQYILFMITNPHTTVLVAAVGEDIVGTISGILSPWFMDFGQGVLTEQWWWVEPGNRGSGIANDLLQHLINWGKAHGAVRLVMVSLGSGIEREVMDLYERRGFTYVESHFIKEI